MDPQELQPGQAHIRLSDSLTWCDLPVLFAEWTFINPEHARIAVQFKRERQPCPRCWAAIQQRR